MAENPVIDSQFRILAPSCYSSLFILVCNISVGGFDSDNTHYCCLLIQTQKVKEIILYKPEHEQHWLVRAAVGNNSDTGGKKCC